MTPSEAISVSCEQIQYWKDRGITANAAWDMLTGQTDTRGHNWARVEAWMTHWLTHGDEERWAA